MPILILGDKNDNEISNLAIKILTPYINIVHMGEVEYLPKGTNIVKDNKFNNKSSIYMYEVETLENLSLENEIIIFKNSFKERHPIYIPDKAICILESSNHAAIKMLAQSNATAITCGTSIKDTFSLASLTPGKAVISVQRNILTLDNKSIEAGDIAINFNDNYKTYSILSVCALAYALGIIPNPRGKYTF